MTQVLAALLARERTGRGAHIVVSMTHGAQQLAPGTPVLTQGFACYSIYACADGRHLTVGALEPKFFARLCELLGRPELAERQYESDQPALRSELAGVFATRPLEDWLPGARRRRRLRGPGCDARGGRGRVRHSARRRRACDRRAHRGVAPGARPVIAAAAAEPHAARLLVTNAASIFTFGSHEAA